MKREGRVVEWGGGGEGGVQGERVFDFPLMRIIFNHL